ncbi:hypothetical protein F01_310067 [Burkholderia cenocepacia]|nr:hypothetical protein F01_310067 [Burkholderia cenocepacia]
MRRPQARHDAKSRPALCLSVEHLETPRQRRDCLTIRLITPDAARRRAAFPLSRRSAS